MFRQTRWHAWCILLAAATQAPAQLTILGQGVVPSGVSADGSVIVGYVPDSHAWIYTPADGQVTNIGGNVPGSMGWGGMVTVSRDGRYVAANNWGANHASELGRYDRVTGEWTMLGNLGYSPTDAEASSAWAISGDGGTVVGLGWLNGGRAHAIAATTSGIVDLTPGTPDQDSRANAVNYDGSVIAGWHNGDSGWQGAMWKDGVETLMFDKDGYALSSVNALSDDGKYAFGDAGWGASLWRWSIEGGYEELGKPLASMDSAAIVAVNSAGTFGVGYSRDLWGWGELGPHWDGIVWGEGWGVMKLTDLAKSQGIDLLGSDLMLPLAISADGRTVVGYDSMYNAWMLKLNPVPEPGTLSAFVVGGLALLRRRASRR